MSIGAALQIIRKKRGLSQRELADRAKITQGFLSLIEKDMREPSQMILKRLADSLNVPLELILLHGLQTTRAKKYSKQLGQIARLVQDILSEVESER